MKKLVVLIIPILLLTACTSNEEDKIAYLEYKNELEKQETFSPEDELDFNVYFNISKEGEEIISNIFLKSWNGYPAEPKDMGYPMVVVGSDICSYMSGQLIYIDFGLTSTWTSGALLQANEKSIEEISRESNE